MIENSPNKTEHEIDLMKLIYKSIKNIVHFLKLNFIAILLLTIAGIFLAYLTTPLTNKYESRILLAPNFNTTDFLYNEIDFINSKIIDKDTVFLQKIGLNLPIQKISIKPINGIYQFVQESDKNFDLVKLFAEDGDINKVAEDEKTSKNYKVHQISILTKYPKLKEQNIETLFKYLNSNQYYNKLKDTINHDLNKRIETNNLTINQINTILDKFSQDLSNQKSQNLVYFNDNNQLNEIIALKNGIIKENESLNQNKLTTDVIIKQIANSLNIKKDSKIQLILFVIFPIALITIFFIIKHFLKKNEKTNPINYY